MAPAMFEVTKRALRNGAPVEGNRQRHISKGE